MVLVGVRDALEAELAGPARGPGPRLRVHHAAEVVAMDEPPAQALRYKKDSSMRVAIDLVKSGEAHACVSAGNTGALMAISRFVLKTLPGIDRRSRPCLPNMRARYLRARPRAPTSIAPRSTCCSSASWARCWPRRWSRRPTIGLLNIGVEDIKGNEAVKQAAALLRASGLNFAGNVEGNDIYRGSVDVVVCDGFVGNVALKCSEGVAEMMAATMREEFSRNALTACCACRGSVLRVPRSAGCGATTARACSACAASW